MTKIALFLLCVNFNFRYKKTGVCKCYKLYICFLYTRSGMLAGFLRTY